jgi:hypothetical protein
LLRALYYGLGYQFAHAPTDLFIIEKIIERLEHLRFRALLIEMCLDQVQQSVFQLQIGHNGAPVLPLLTP